MVDPQRVRSRLTMLRAYRDRLTRLRNLPLETYLAEHDLEGRYALQVAAQICIDVANHVIASNGWEPATEFRESFTRLEEHELLDAQLAERLRDLAGQRNLLVHLYGDVDDALLHEHLQTGLDDFDAFARAVARLLG